MTLTPQHGMLTVVTDDDLLATAKRALPLVSDLSLRTAVTMFRQVCAVNNVVLLRATPDDFTTIQQRKAVGWSDDRP